MKRFVTIPALVLCLACLMDVSAQELPDNETPVTKHSIGLNATGLLNNILNPDSEDNRMPFLITYDLIMDKLVFRAGIGPEFMSETVVHEGFTDSQKRTDLQLDGRLGAGFRVVDDVHWNINAGLDIVGRYAVEKTTDDTGFDKVTDEVESQRIGGGPFVQIDYKISPRVSLGTEAALYFSHKQTTHTELFENFPDFNNQLSKTTGTQLDTFLPTSIFVHLHF